MSKFRVIGSLIAFLILAGISCWATEKSLNMLLPEGWPEILVWGITIVFFIVASIGTKLITDSLMSNEFVEYRKVKLWGGIFLVVFFWLLMSMPTNTHTFFYDEKIGSTISKDIETTNNYLQQVIDMGSNSSTVVLDARGKAIKDSVEELITHIDNQFHGDEAPYKGGDGPLIGNYLEQINKILNSQLAQNPGTRYSKNPSILNRYHVEIRKALSNALKTHTISEQSVQAARKQKKRLAALNDSIQNHIASKSLTKAEIRQCEKELKDGYNIVATNKAFIQFSKNSDDEEVYTKEDAETRTKRMSSVIDVFFVDFLQGKYPGSFWYYILFSILVDVAAFIFFGIAFMKKNN